MGGYFSNQLNNNYSYVYFLSSFECGFNSTFSVFTNFSSSFLVLLVFFVLLDVEVVLLINTCLEIKHYNNFFYFLVFVLIVLVGFFYEIYIGLITFF
uniref:NADH-ubiquinone oxidoreductase chain 3 n=1 Tax=Neomazocraes dorosomatis TaxID=1131909 RepID=A0A3G0X1J5_9PLAT|nr:NADH dehydrogenase subunit 3 [Neomazocraes dorosomatis]